MPLNLPSEVRMIDVTAIDVLNPRERNEETFDEIVVNIKRVGLKKPISVTPRHAADGGERYLLVCGEGRLRAFKALGEAQIPALVVHVDDDDAFIMSLAENIARRKYRPLELLSGIEQMREKGLCAKDIASKTGLTQTYVQGILTLLQQGEQRLIVAVERGEIPLNAAVTIASAGDDDKAIQSALQGRVRSRHAAGKEPSGRAQSCRATKSAGKESGSRIITKAGAGYFRKSHAHVPEGSSPPKACRKEGRVHPAGDSLHGERAEATPQR